MKRILLSLGLILSFSYTQAQVLVSSQALDTTSRFFLNFLVSGSQYDVVTYKLTYNTTDVDGSNTVASMAISLPLNTPCDTFSLVSYNHGTVLQKDDVPSRNNYEANIGKAFASRGYVAVMPDYLGLGDNPGLHPYLHAESQATATIDAMRAGREFIANNMADSIKLNGEVFLTGYSQGGHAAMGTAKYIQDNNLFSEFNLVGAAPASGPYNLSGSQSQVFIDNDPYSNPGYVVYLLMGMNRVYGNIYQNLSDILKSPYDTTMPPLFDGTQDMSVVNAQLPSKISDYLVDTVLQNFVGDTVGQTHPIWQALNNNTNYDWNPQMPMRLFYCTNDEQVEFQNSVDAAAAMKSYGASVKAVSKGFRNHGDCVVPSLLGAATFFDSAGTSCNRNALPVNLWENQKRSISIYPNPASQSFQISGIDEQTTVELSLMNSKGQIVRNMKVNAGEAIQTSDLASGLYIGIVDIDNQRSVFRLIVE